MVYLIKNIGYVQYTLYWIIFLIYEHHFFYDEIIEYKDITIKWNFWSWW